jgi:tRNA modification GTPase
MPVALDTNDTIAAIASPPGPAPRGIVRLSGPAAISTPLESFIPRNDESMPPGRARVVSGSLRVDGLRPLLPVMLGLWPAPRTYTGQDLAEIHLVGASPLVNLVLAHCLGRGARAAEPGEFTLRAFLSGRIDLTRAEAVLGVIEAQNPAQLGAALEQLAGGLSGPIMAMRNHLLDVVAHLEANLDFTEEPDVDLLGRAALAGELEHSAAELEMIERQLSARDRPDGRPRVVLFGPPNVGKSRLYNALVGNGRAIVSPQAGTTRDYLSAVFDCDGLTVELVDTAGVEAADDSISTQAQALRGLQVDRADLLLVCRAADTPDRLAAGLAPDCRKLLVWTKSDRGLRARDGDGDARDAIITSAATGYGLEALRSAIAVSIRCQENDGNLPAGTAARCRGSLRRAREALGQASECLLRGDGEELVAFDLRSAVDELGKVVGAVVTDDILDRIFSRFCIGK